MPLRRISKGVTRGQPLTFHFNGEAIEAYAGESLAAALMASGIYKLRREAPGGSGPRGGLCLMGICQECVVLVNGRRVEACRHKVHDGLEVQSVS